jgi:hypothetical protein
VNVSRAAVRAATEDERTSRAKLIDPDAISRVLAHRAPSDPTRYIPPPPPE